MQLCCYRLLPAPSLLDKPGLAPLPQGETIMGAVATAGSAQIVVANGD